MTGDIESTALTVRFLEIVTVMLKAVFFYLIGVGLYSLFISPLNLTVALGVKTLSDLEAKIMRGVIVILAVSFMELFIAERGDMTVLISAAALALAVIALVLFQWHAHRAGLDHSDHRPGEVEHAKAELFEHSHERHAPRRPDGAPAADQPPASTPSDADTTR